MPVPSRSSLVLLASTACGTTAGPAAPPPSGAGAAGREWRSLFDGSSKAGWHPYNGLGDGSAWTIDDGALHIAPNDGTGRGDLVSDDEFGDFHLRFEWRLLPGGNGGVFVYVQEVPDTDRAWQTGPEIQLLDDAGHPDGAFAKHRVGDLYDLLEAHPGAARAPGEWNQTEIVAVGGALEFRINGVSVLRTTLWDEAWAARIAASKFKDLPGFGTYRRGRIGLQDHWDPVWYRAIEIKEL
jgi:hypothetical protein